MKFVKRILFFFSLFLLYIIIKEAFTLYQFTHDVHPVLGIATLIAIAVILALAITVADGSSVRAGQVWTKCHVTCRCLQNDQVANFTFLLPLDVSPDMGFEADQLCRARGHAICLDACNSSKFSYTYQVTSP